MIFSFFSNSSLTNEPIAVTASSSVTNVNKRKKKSITNTSVDEDEENCEESLGINDEDLIENDDVEDIAEANHLNGDVDEDNRREGSGDDNNNDNDEEELDLNMNEDDDVVDVNEEDAIDDVDDVDDDDDDNNDEDLDRNESSPHHHHHHNNPVPSAIYDENNNLVVKTTHSPAQPHLKLKVTPSVSTAFQLATGSQALNSKNISAIESCLNQSSAYNSHNSDLIVCGECQADFKLENILDFIDHKIQKCSKAPYKLMSRGVGKNKQQQHSKNLLNKSDQSGHDLNGSDCEQTNENNYQGNKEFIYLRFVFCENKFQYLNFFAEISEKSPNSVWRTIKQ